MAAGPRSASSSDWTARVRWNLVGGRIRRGEKIGAALRRHLLSTLGHGVSWARRGEATMHRWFDLGGSYPDAAKSDTTKQTCSAG